MDPIEERKRLLTRRHFFSRTSTGLGAAALASLLSSDLHAGTGLAGMPSLRLPFIRPLLAVGRTMRPVEGSAPVMRGGKTLR